MHAHLHDDAAMLRQAICCLEHRQARRRAHAEELAKLIAWHDGQLVLLRAHEAGVYPPLRVV